MNKIEEIFRAWSISFNPNDAQSDLASERIQICDACEFRVLTPIGPFMNIARCSVCGCALRAKIYTIVTYKDPGGSCPHNKWSSVEDTYLASKNI